VKIREMMEKVVARQPQVVSMTIVHKCHALERVGHG